MAIVNKAPLHWGGASLLDRPHVGGRCRRVLTCHCLWVRTCVLSLSDQDNAYIYALGFSVAPGEDPGHMGSKRVAWMRQSNRAAHCDTANDRIVSTDREHHFQYRVQLVSFHGCNDLFFAQVSPTDVVTLLKGSPRSAAFLRAEHADGVQPQKKGTIRANCGIVLEVNEPEADRIAGLLRRQTICAGLMSALVELDRP
jgi:hypothetical protein